MCTHRNGKICSLILYELQNKYKAAAGTRPSFGAGDPTLPKDAAISQDGDDYMLSNRTQSLEANPQQSPSRIPTIEVHARDFLASLSRITQIND